jgi:hypothetical protein
MTAVFNLENLAPVVARVSLVKLTQVYGLPVLVYFTRLSEESLLKMLNQNRLEAAGALLWGEPYQLADYTETIAKLILEKYPELDCLRETEAMAKEYQFLGEELANWEMELEERINKVVEGEHAYCVKIGEIRKKYGLQPAYVFT